MRKYRMQCRLHCSSSQKRWLTKQLQALENDLQRVIEPMHKRQAMLMKQGKFQCLARDEKERYLDKRRMWLPCHGGTSGCNLFALFLCNETDDGTYF